MQGDSVTLHQAGKGLTRLAAPGKQAVDHLFQQALQSGGTLWLKGKRVAFGHVVHLRQLQLDRMLLLVWLAVSAGDVTALEATVKHVGELLLLLFAAGHQAIAQRWGAAFTAVGAQIKVW